MSKATFQLVYDGPALAENEMAARELSSALMAMDLLLEEADSVINKGKTETSLTVKASFKTGCFKIDFNSYQQIAQRFKDLFNSDIANAVSNAEAIIGAVFAGLVALLLWLKRRKITKMEMVDGKIRVFVADQYMDVEKRTIDLLRNHKLREAMELVIRKPLEREGIDTVAIVQHEKVTITIDKSDKDSFAVEVMDEVTLQDTHRFTHLHLVSPSFQGGDKWRVNDGGSNFHVAIEDQNFIERVLRGEVEFGASTVLKVSLREVQYTDAHGSIKKECTIEKVLDVVKPYEQMEMTLPDSVKALPFSEKKSDSERSLEAES